MPTISGDLCFLSACNLLLEVHGINQCCAGKPLMNIVLYDIYHNMFYDPHGDRDIPPDRVSDFQKFM